MTVKRHAVNPSRWHSSVVQKSLDDVVVARLKAEMDRRRESANSLARKCKLLGYRTGQTTISAILRGKQSARVETLEKLAAVLEIEPWLLLTEPGALESLLARSGRPALPAPTATVHQLAPPPYGPMLSSGKNGQHRKKVSARGVRKR